MILQERFQLMHDAKMTSVPNFYQARKMQLIALKKSLKKHREHLIEAVNQDFSHRSAYETAGLEIFSIYQTIDYTLKHLHGWMRARPVSLPWWLMFGRASVIAEPKGIVGIIVPWNYPIHLSLAPLIAAIAAGNRVMLKCSRRTPKTAQVLSDILQEVFTLQEMQVIFGSEQASDEFLRLPFDHIFFTGSSETGKKIMQSAAERLIPVTLELGGKSPVYIAENYPIQRAVDAIMTGKLVNAGQTCIAPDYLFMQESAVQLFVEKAKRFVAMHYPNILDNDDYTAIIDHKQHERLTLLLEDAKKKGADVVPLAEVSAHKKTQKFIPHIVLNVTDEMRLMQEEIFGPILPIKVYESDDKVIHYLQGKPAPLAMYLFDDNQRRVNYFIDKIPSGGVTVNDVMLHAASEELPFGGVGQSGMGNYHGKFGFDIFTHYRSVYHQSSINLLRLARPPYGKWIRRFLNWRLK